MIKETLEKAGLTDEKIEVYLSLLEKGPQTAGEIAKNTSVKRTYVYKICTDLKSDSLVKIEKKKNTTIFYPASPALLTELAEKKKAEAQEVANKITSVINILNKNYDMNLKRSTIKVHKGEKDVKKIIDKLKLLKDYKKRAFKAALFLNYSNNNVTLVIKKSLAVTLFDDDLFKEIVHGEE